MSNPRRAARQKVLDELLEDRRVSLRARGRSLSTIDSYLTVGSKFAGFLNALPAPTSSLAALKREHIESYLAGMRDRGLSPATVAKP